MNLAQELYLDTTLNKIGSEAYYQVSVRPVSSTLIYASFYTTGRHLDTETMRETRLIDRVHPEYLVKGFQEAKLGLSIINESNEFKALITVSGHALIAKRLIDIHWKEIKAPKLIVNTFDKGFFDYDLIGGANRSRTLRGEARMEVL